VDWSRYVSYVYGKRPFPIKPVGPVKPPIYHPPVYHPPVPRPVPIRPPPPIHRPSAPPIHRPSAPPIRPISIRPPPPIHRPSPLPIYHPLAAIPQRRPSMSLDNEVERLSDIERTVNDVIDFANDHNLTETAKRFSHWLDGSGDALPLDVDWLRTTVSIQNAEEWNDLRFTTNPHNEAFDKSKPHSILEIARTMKDGETRSFSDNWKKVVTYSQEVKNSLYPIFQSRMGKDCDLLFSVGNTQLESTGVFKVTRRGDEYAVSGSVTHSIADKFDFNSGDIFLVPEVVPFISANELNLLEKYGIAKSFSQDTAWHQKLDAKGTLNDLRNPDIYNWHLSR
jgi:hypothetical protein